MGNFHSENFATSARILHLEESLSKGTDHAMEKFEEQLAGKLFALESHLPWGG